MLKYRYVVPYILSNFNDERDKIVFIHVWTKAKPDGYIQTVYKALDYYCYQFLQQKIGDIPIILAGDFNFGVEINDPFLTDFDKKIGEHGFKNYAHIISHNEQKQTFYYPRYPERKYFNDCIFVKNCEMKEFKIGKKEDWIDNKYSDHCPVFSRCE